MSIQITPNSGSGDLRSRVATVPTWFHSIDVGQGILTPGHKTQTILTREWRNMCLPSLKGKTVLDINTWDGYFAFEAERQGAESVTGLDFYVWATDWEKRTKYEESMRKNYHQSDLSKRVDYLEPHSLPGKKGFDLVHELRKSRVKQVVGDFMEMNLNDLGRFDISFFLGSLYHMKNPLESLERLCEVTGELAVIETDAVEVPGVNSRPLLEFFPRDKLDHVCSNWWAPNAQALSALCLAAGFKRVDIVKGPRYLARWRIAGVAKNIILRKRPSTAWRYRAVAHAWK